MWTGTGPGRTETCGKEKRDGPPAKVNLTSSELVVKMDEIKFDCMISSKVDVIDRMKI